MKKKEKSISESSYLKLRFGFDFRFSIFDCSSDLGFRNLGFGRDGVKADLERAQGSSEGSSHVLQRRSHLRSSP